MLTVINSFFHLIGLGLLCTTIFGGLIIEQRIRSEKDWNYKLILTKLYNRFYWIFIIASFISILTGILLMIDVYGPQTNIFNAEGWLVAKIILFGFFIVNGIFLGPTIIRKRTKSIQNVLDKSTEEEHNIKVFGKNILTYYLIQLILLVVIIVLSVIGSSDVSK